VVCLLFAGAGGRLARPSGRLVVSGAGLLAAVAGAFVLTIARSPQHPPLHGAPYDPDPAYAAALGGNGTAFLDEYRVAAELPAFVGNATHRGEQLLTWTTRDTTGLEIDELGEYRSTFNLLPSSPPVLTRADRAKLDERRPAELLLLGPSGGWMPAATAALAPYDPTVLRSAVLRAGSYTLFVRLLALHAYPPLPAAGAG
jgi:hypothetical protein